MMRVVTATSAAYLFMAPLFTTTLHAVSVAGLIAVLLTVVGIATVWRWPIVAAACVFLTTYTLALWVEQPRVSVGPAVAVGLALFLLLQSAELTRCSRHAIVGGGVVRAQVWGWVALAGATGGTGLIAMLVARLAAGTIPLAAAPFLAALGALGTVLALATALINAGRRG